MARAAGLLLHLREGKGLGRLRPEWPRSLFRRPRPRVPAETGHQLSGDPGGVWAVDLDVCLLHGCFTAFPASVSSKYARSVLVLPSVVVLTSALRKRFSAPLAAISRMSGEPGPLIWDRPKVRQGRS